jgi:hypothetical protein
MGRQPFLHPVLIRLSYSQGNPLPAYLGRVDVLTVGNGRMGIYMAEEGDV